MHACRRVAGRHALQSQGHAWPYVAVHSLHHRPHPPATRALGGQGITCIEGLEGCTALEQLWLPENRIASLDGLAHLPRLRELYAYSNRCGSCDACMRLAPAPAERKDRYPPTGTQRQAPARRRPGALALLAVAPAANAQASAVLAPSWHRLTASTGLEALTTLTALSLADNYLRRIEGLGGLGRLVQLDLAGNQISVLDGELAGCAALRTLNLAANRVASFSVRCARRGTVVQLVACTPAAAAAAAATAAVAAVVRIRP